MAYAENGENTVTSVEEIQRGWHQLTTRVGQLEEERDALEEENKTLRFLLERVIEHRQKSHGELVLLLTSLVSKLPINDVGVVVAKLLEHNSHVSEVCNALSKGSAETTLPQPTVLKALDQTRRELRAALKPLFEELIGLEAPLDGAMLRSLESQPELFFTPPVVRATRCFIKGQVPRERILQEFGEPALVLFNDLTTDPKRNPNPKPEEIVLGFKSDFERLFEQNAALIPNKRKNLLDLYQKVQQSKAPTEAGRSQRNAFLKVSFVIELLHYYENENTEAPDVIFAQRLPALIEQLVLNHPEDSLNEELIAQAEHLVAFVINPDHRHAIINNLGKGGGTAKTLKYIFKLRVGTAPGHDPIVTDFVKHLLPRQNPPLPETLATVLRLVNPEAQRSVILAIMDSDRIRKEEAQALGKEVGRRLRIEGLELPKKAAETVPVEIERQMAWDKIKDLIGRRTDPTTVAGAIRGRLHAKYNAEEIKQSWIVLTEGNPISLIRIFCQLPYLADGKTDPLARTVMQTYLTRLMHEKYAATYHKVLNSLKNTLKANPNSPTLLNFMALVKWVDAESANKLSLDLGLAAPARQGEK